MEKRVFATRVKNASLDWAVDAVMYGGDTREVICYDDGSWQAAGMSSRVLAGPRALRIAGGLESVESGGMQLRLIVNYGIAIRIEARK